MNELFRAMSGPESTLHDQIIGSRNNEYQSRENSHQVFTTGFDAAAATWLTGAESIIKDQLRTTVI